MSLFNGMSFIYQDKQQNIYLFLDIQLFYIKSNITFLSKSIKITEKYITHQLFNLTLPRFIKSIKFILSAQAQSKTQQNSQIKRKMNKKQQLKKDDKKQVKKQTKKDNKKDNKIIIKQNILQTMKGQIDFLNIFTLSEINFLFENYDVIVFDRGMVLVKQKQIIDYVGVILNGGAIAEKSKTKYKSNSFIGNIVAINGFQAQQKHSETIIAQSDGILLAIRIQSILNISKNDIQLTIKTKIINFLAEQTLSQLKNQRHFKSNIQGEFQLVDQKISQKFYQTNKLLSTLMQAFVGDAKEKLKFIEEFPLQCAKQKTLISSRNQKPYFLIVVKGQITKKLGLGLKKQIQVLQANHLYNGQGFIFGHTQFSNLYCSSSQVVFLKVNKQRLISNFKISTLMAVLKYCLQYEKKSNQYQFRTLKLILQNDGKSGSTKQIWSPFKKPYTIQELPVKKQRIKGTGTSTAIQSKKKDSINVFQSLYTLYSQNSSKNKLHSKQTQLTEYRTERAITLRTEYSQNDKQNVNTGSNDKFKRLQNEVFQLKDQNKLLADRLKIMRMDLVQYKTRASMQEVFRQVRNYNTNKISANTSALTKGQTKNVSLKQAYEQHLKAKKLQLLVAKCAFKWLQICRRNRSKRQNHQSSSSLLKQSLQTK